MGRHDLVTQPTPKPTAKVLATWLAGGGGTLVLGVLTLVSDQISAETFWGGLTAAVLAGAAGYLQKSRRGEA